MRILGAGRARCRTLAARTAAAPATLGLDLVVETIDDPWVIAECRVMRIPHLVIADRAVVSG